MGSYFWKLLDIAKGKKVVNMKKKVLLVSCQGLGRGGVQSVLMNIVRDLSDEFQFDIIVFTKDKRYYEDEFESYGGKIFRIPCYFGRNKVEANIEYYGRAIRLMKEAKRILKDNGPYNAIHCSNNYESGLFVKVAHDLGVPNRIVHAHIISGKYFFLRRPINSLYMKWIKNYATDMIGCSVEACSSFYGEEIQGTVVNNMYDDEKFNLERYSNPDYTHIRLIQIGSYSSLKNQKFTVKVLEDLRKLGCTADLRFVGFDLQGTYENELRRLVAEKKLESVVEFYPHDANIPQLLSESTALVMPSIEEGFGMVLIEGQAMGIRCYASDSIPRATDCGGCVYLSLNDGSLEWAKKIQKDFYEGLQQHERYDCSRFSKKHILKEYSNLYSKH